MLTTRDWLSSYFLVSAILLTLNQKRNPSDTWEFSGNGSKMYSFCIDTLKHCSGFGITWGPCSCCFGCAAREASLRGAGLLSPGLCTGRLGCPVPSQCLHRFLPLHLGNVAVVVLLKNLIARAPNLQKLCFTELWERSRAFYLFMAGFKL